MSAKAERYNQALIPKEELELFKLTVAAEIPWRDPVSYWVPTHADIKAMEAIARSVVEQPTVVDVGCGNAFISHLLAQEVPVIGIDPNEELLAKTPYRHPNLELISGTVEEADKLLRGRSVDVVVSSWMPQRTNLADGIYALKPKAIIFVRDAWGYTGTHEAYQFREGYHRTTWWGGIATGDLSIFFDDLCDALEPRRPKRYYTVDEAKRHERWETVFRKDIEKVRTRGIAVCNIIDVRFRNDIPAPEFPIQIDQLLPYDWENDLQHILSNTLVRKQIDELSLQPPIVLKD